MSVHVPKRSTVSRCHSSSKRIGTVKNGKSTMVTRGKAAQLKERQVASYFLNFLTKTSRIKKSNPPDTFPSCCREVHEVASILLSFAAKARVAPDRIKMPATQAELNSDKFPYSLFLLPPSSPLFSLLSPSSAEAMTIVEETLQPDTISNLSTKPKAAIGKKKRKRTTKAQLAVLGTHLQVGIQLPSNPPIFCIQRKSSSPIRHPIARPGKNLADYLACHLAGTNRCTPCSLLILTTSLCSLLQCPNMVPKPSLKVEERHFDGQAKGGLHSQRVLVPEHGYATAGAKDGILATSYSPQRRISHQTGGVDESRPHPWPRSPGSVHLLDDSFLLQFWRSFPFACSVFCIQLGGK